MSISINRRKFLLGTGVASSLSALPGCGATTATFLHGVASGDPLPDRVVLWTRATPPGLDTGPLTIVWEVATDALFHHLASRGKISTSAERDFTVKVDAAGLKPGKQYFYRFIAGDVISPIGRTRTLPDGDVSDLSLAVVSCSNYGHGFFNVYAEIAANRDFQAVIHLGDYIYEYAVDVYVNSDLSAQRRVEPEHELLSLDDYRARHALYKSDPQLQAAHAAHPFICVWDDHELSNDTWSGGAENHQLEEGAWIARRDSAIRAYREWLPIRDTENRAAEVSYRSFNFGNLVSLIMLDTRVVGRDKQLDYQADMIWQSLPFDVSDANSPTFINDPERLSTTQPQHIKYITVPFDVAQTPPVPVTDWKVISALDPEKLPPGFAYLPDVERFVSDKLHDANRTILGRPQEQWLRQQLANSKRANIPWQLLGQQVLMGKVVGPDFGDLWKEVKDPVIAQRIKQLTTISKLGLPLNLDTWDGYWAARERLLEMINKDARNAVVITGDSHNAWAFELSGKKHPDPVAVELAVSSITSPGFEKYLPIDTEEAAKAFVRRNPELQYADFRRRGWLEISFNPQAMEAQWKFVTTAVEKKYAVVEGKRYRVEAGESRLKPLTL